MNDPDSFRFLDLILSVIQKIPLDNKKTKGIFVYKKVMYINLVIPSVLKIKTAQQGKLTSRRNLKKRELPITHLERYPYQSFWTKLRPISFMNILPVEVFSSFFYFHDFERFSSFFCVTAGRSVMVQLLAQPILPSSSDMLSPVWSLWPFSDQNCGIQVVV